MLRISDFFSQAAQPSRIFLCLTLAAAVLDGCAPWYDPSQFMGKSAPAVEKQPVTPAMPTLVLINKKYRAKKAASIRSAPDPAAAVVARLQPKERFTAVAKVEHGGWLLVGKNNRSIGFVEESLVQPIVWKKKITAKKKNTVKKKSSTLAPQREGINLDKISDSYE